jgi:hypothetical protein
MVGAPVYAAYAQLAAHRYVPCTNYYDAGVSTAEVRFPALQVRLASEVRLPELYRFFGRLDEDLSASADSRRRKSAKARNRGSGIADSATGYGELGSRGTVAMVEFGGRNWQGRATGG